MIVADERKVKTLFERFERSYALIQDLGHDAQARQIFRNLVRMPADVTTGLKKVEVSFHGRAHLPIILASGLMETPVPVPRWTRQRLTGPSLRMVRSTHFWEIFFPPQNTGLLPIRPAQNLTRPPNTIG